MKLAKLETLRLAGFPNLLWNPLEIERISRSLIGYLGFRGSGVETRAVSAFDIAL